MSNILPKTFFDEVKARLRLSDIVGRRVKLTRKGREYAACCPFHKEKSASFYVNDDKAFFHCFGCGAHGDHIGFVMRADNVDFMDAVEKLAGEAGIAVPRPSPAEAQRLSRHDHLLRVMDWAAGYYEDALKTPVGAEALTYLQQKRGLKDDTISAFRLGYATDGGEGLYQHLKAKGASDTDLLDVGLFKKSTRAGGGLFPFFRHRVLFPVMDKRGRVIAFGGRVLPGADKDAPKYLNSGETALYQKGHTLYNESNARAAAGQGKPVIVCEGYLDVIALWQAGFAGAVAPLGTALTEPQIASLWDMCARGAHEENGAAAAIAMPYLCFDGDGAGQRAALRALDRMLPMLSPGRSAAFVFLPQGQDPDDVVRTGGGDAAFGALLAQAKPFVEVLWESTLGTRAYKTPEARAGLLKAIEDRVAQIADKTVQTEYRRALKDLYYSRVAGLTRLPPSGARKKQVDDSVAPPSPQFLDDARVPLLLGIVAYDPSIFFQVEEELGMLHVADAAWDRLRQVMLTALSEDGDLPDRETFLAHLAQRGFTDQLARVDSLLRLHARHLFRRADDTRTSVSLFRALCKKERVGR